MAAIALGRGSLGRSELRFPVVFLLYWALLTILYVIVGPLRPAIIAGTTRLAVWGSALAGLAPQALPGPPEAIPITFQDGVFTYLITMECTAVLLAILYTAAVLAYPASWRQRAVGLGIGLPLLALLNTMRLVVLGWVGLYVPSIFDAIHQFWYQALLVAVVGLGWFAWVWLLVGRRDSPGSRARRLGTSLVVFASALAVLALLGVAGLAHAYGRLLSRVVWVIGGLVYDDPDVTWSFSDAGLLTLYAKSAGLVALFLATPSVEWSERWRDLARLFLPVLFALHASALFVSYAVARSAATGGFWADAPAYLSTTARLTTAICTGVVVPIALWFVWVRRQWKSEGREEGNGRRHPGLRGQSAFLSRGVEGRGGRRARALAFRGPGGDRLRSRDRR